MTPRFEYNIFIDGPLAWMFVGRGRKPGGQLLRRKRLLKKHVKWRSVRVELQRAAQAAVHDSLMAVANERSFVRDLMGSGSEDISAVSGDET